MINTVLKAFSIGICVSCLITSCYANSCCGIGSSVAYTGHPEIQKGNILLLYGVNYTSSTLKTVQKNTLSILIAYGITKSLSLNTKINYSWMKNNFFKPGRFDTTGDVIEIIIPDTTLVFKNDGLEDASLSAQYICIPLNGITKKELKLGILMSFPWSQSKKTTLVKGLKTVLPASIQTGLGVYVYSGYMAYSHLFPFKKIMVSGAFTAGLKTPSNDGTKYGVDYSAVASCGYGPVNSLRYVLSSSYTHFGTSRDNAAIIADGTGGYRIDYTGILEYTAPKFFKISLRGDLPLITDKVQKKYGKNISIGLNCTHNFSLFN